MERHVTSLTFFIRRVHPFLTTIPPPPAVPQVAGSTAQLLVACKVKADPDSAATRRLQEAGNRVKKATDNLVRAAQQAIEQDEERSLILNKRLVGGLAQELDAQSDVSGDRGIRGGGEGAGVVCCGGGSCI